MEMRMNSKDLALLISVQQYFKNTGYISHNAKTNTVSYSITKLSDLVNIVIPHFNNYPLKTKKQADYLLFREILMMMQRREHLTSEGLEKIVSIRASIN